MLYVGNQKLKPPGKILTTADHYDSEIEYIEGNGTLWIDCRIFPKLNTKIQFKFVNLQVTGDTIIGYNNGNDTMDYRFFNYNSNGYFDVPGGSGSGNRIISSSKISVNTEYELELGNYYILNLATNTIIAQRATLYTTYGNDTIKLNKHSNSITKNRFYYVKIYENDIPVFDGIPVRVGQIGYMYDKISGKLFENKGTGNFILGPDKEDLL